MMSPLSASRSLLFSVPLLLSLLLLQACPAVFLGGAAATTSLVIDRRTAAAIVDDEAIELTTMRKLRANDTFAEQSTHVNVTSFNGIVLLTGEVPSQELNDLVVTVASNLRNNVRHIHNELTLATPSAILSRSSDTLLTAKIKTKMLGKSDLRGVIVKVVSEKGTVYLMGLVTQEEADIAIDVARKTRGVERVVQLFEFVTEEELK